jgi:hypothetical protein
MPGGSQITLHVNGAAIRAASRMAPSWTPTATARPVACSRQLSPPSAAPRWPGPRLVSARWSTPVPDLEPMTFDDIRPRRRRVIHTADDVFLPPSPRQGLCPGPGGPLRLHRRRWQLRLTDVPAGTVKVAIDGRTATNAPAGVFFPEMVMDAELLEPGVTNTLMGSMGTAAKRLANMRPQRGLSAARADQHAAVT